MPLFCHVAEAVESAISWKLFTYGGRKGLLEYTDQVYCMDTSNMLWIKPPLSAEGTKAPSAREYCAAVFDPKGARMLFFGGWANCWLGDVHSLNVSGIVGPSYAVTDVRPIRGPLSGGRAVTVVGINFVPHPKIEVKFITAMARKLFRASTKALPKSLASPHPLSRLVRAKSR